MKYNIEDVKKKLSNEFQWLLSNYPLTSFNSIELKIYNYKDYNQFYSYEHQDSYEEKETSAFLTEILSKDRIEYAIFMVVSENFIPDETDKMIMERNRIEDGHLFNWILYHEYGHLRQLHKTFLKLGLPGLIKEKEVHEEELERLWNQKSAGRISEREYEIKYRDLSFEKSADHFADQVYQVRKPSLPTNPIDNNV